MREEIQEQVNEILKHKWLMSEKAGYDVGIQTAALDWISKYAGQWREHKTKTKKDNSHNQ